MAIPQMRQPLNMLENRLDLKNFIKRDPPKAVWATRRHKVSVGDTMRSNPEEVLDYYGGHVLAVAHDKNKTRYGQTSERFAVNKGFRPPIIDPWDQYSIPRRPRPNVRVRANPEGGDFTPTNARTQFDITAYLYSDEHGKVERANVRPTYKIKLSRGAHEIYEDAKKVELQDLVPHVYATASKYVPVRLQREHQYAELERTMPYVEVTARTHVPVKMCADTPEVELEDRRAMAYDVTTNPRARCDLTDYAAVADVDGALNDDFTPVSYTTPARVRYNKAVEELAPELKDGGVGRAYVGGFSISETIPGKAVPREVTLRDKVSHIPWGF